MSDRKKGEERLATRSSDNASRSSLARISPLRPRASPGSSFLSVGFYEEIKKWRAPFAEKTSGRWMKTPNERGCGLPVCIRCIESVEVSLGLGTRRARAYPRSRLQYTLKKRKRKMMRERRSSINNNKKGCAGSYNRNDCFGSLAFLFLVSSCP